MRISDWSSDVCSSDLRARSHATLSWRAGWAWCTVEGDAELIGPDDPVQGVTLPPLLRSIYASSGGGEHDDWADYDRVMAAERRLAVLVHPADRKSTRLNSSH